MFLRGGGGGVGEGGKGKIPAFKNFKNVRRRTHHSSVVLAIKCYLKSSVRVLSTCVTCSKRWYEVNHASLVSCFGNKMLLEICRACLVKMRDL